LSGLARERVAVGSAWGIRETEAERARRALPVQHPIVQRTLYLGEDRDRILLRRF